VNKRRDVCPPFKVYGGKGMALIVGQDGSWLIPGRPHEAAGDERKRLSASLSTEQH
jgi:hypothetical protein